MNRSDDAHIPDAFPAAPSGSSSPAPNPHSRWDDEEDDSGGGSQMRLPGAGSVVFDRYRLLHVLGRGGMGVVWLAEDTKLSRTVALKFLPDILGTDLVALNELKEETRRGLELAHPHIVRIYDFVDDEEAAAISMEFVNGKTLSDMRVAKSAKVFTAAELSPWVREICDALDYAHLQCQLVHRDLKPANIMVNSESHVKITDFGIARSMTETLTRISLSGAGTSGTMIYMSPQQIMGERPAPTDDVYSLGATLFELLTTKPPFFRGDISAQVTSKKPPTIAERRAELNIAAPDIVPEVWESAIAACLEKDPALRPQSAGELAERLGLAPPTVRVPVATQPSMPLPVAADTATTSVTTRRAAKPMSRRARWMTAAGALLAVLLLALWWTNRPADWSLDTHPSGALVTFNGVTQPTPATFRKIPPGAQEAVIRKDGYEPRQIEFSLDPGQQLNMGIVNLSPALSAVPVEPEPTSGEFVVRSIATLLAPPQPSVGEPKDGSWTLAQIFMHSEYAPFSANGRHYILREAQRRLKEREHYKGEINGDANAEVYTAIKAFQEEVQLRQTGMLDSATIQHLGLTAMPDKSNWALGVDESKDDGWWSRNFSKPLRRLFAK